MSEDEREPQAELLKAARDHKLMTARMGVLHSSASAMSTIALQLTPANGTQQDTRIAAAALLVRLGSELIGSIALLLQARRSYPAASLLRQLIETATLLAAAAEEPRRLDEWLGCEPDELEERLRAAARSASDPDAWIGEYASHRRSTLHPHAGAVPILGAYPGDPTPLAFLLPSCAWHARRSWEAAGVLVSRLELPLASASARDLAGQMHAAITAWERREPEPVLRYLRGRSVTETGLVTARYTPSD